MKKNIMLLLTVVVVLIALIAVFSVKQVSTTIEIPLPPEQVWQTLVDPESYPLWNATLEPIEGEIRAGGKVKYRWTPAGGEPIEVTSRVTKLVAPVRLEQRGGTPGVLAYHHRYLLIDVGGNTSLTQRETYRGIGVWFWDASQMQPAYERVNQSLKEYLLTKGSK